MRAHCDRPAQDALYQSLQPVADCLDRVQTARQIGREDYDAWESDIIRLPDQLRWLRKGYGQFGREVSREAMVRRGSSFRTIFRPFAHRRMRTWRRRCAMSFGRWSAKYQDAKERLGKLDFADLLISRPQASA